MTPEQARMARALLQIGVREAAAAAGIAPNTVSRVENGADAKSSTMDALRVVYEARGVVFVQPGGTVPGPAVCLAAKGPRE